MKNLPLNIQNELEEYFKEHNVPSQKKEKIIQKVNDIYKKMRYDSEEAIGIVCAQSLSEPATQMSLDFSEKIILKHNGVIKIAPIGEFIDRTIEKLGKKVVSGWEICDISDYGLFVPSINNEEKIEWKPVSEISRHASPEKILEIKTRSGRKIKATDSHSFVIRKNNKIIPVSGKELIPGDRIPSISFLPENCLQSLEMQPLLGQQLYAKKQLPEKLKLDNSLGWIFGAYLAEGNATKFYVSFSNTNPLFLSKIRNFAGKYGFTFNEYDNFRGFAPAHDIRINSKQFSLLMQKTCATGSENKRVPEFAYSADIEFVSGLIRGYFDGDGNVSVDRRVIRISSKSEELLDGIALLLTRFGIFARKSKNKKENLLTIPYKYAENFRKNIGFVIESKAQKLDELCSLFEKNKGSYQDFVDMIGGFDDILLSISSKLGEPSRYVNSFTKRQKIGRTVLLKHIKAFEKKALKKNIDISKELNILKRMHSSDVVWDEISETTYIKPSREYVYDFTVPGTETFTTFDGIVTHNTMRTYHFAGTAGIQVTLGLPRILEIFDARKEPRTPAMTVYLENKKASIEDAKKVAESIKEVKLRDIVLSTVLDLTGLGIICRLDIDKIKKLEIEAEKLPKTLKARNVDIKVKDNMLFAIPKKKEMKGLQKMKYSLLETHIKGIKGISQVVITKENDEWIISTMGSNLKKVFAVEGVNPMRTVTNDLFEIYHVLGVEAARNAIVKEARYIMDEQGLNVDTRYIMLLADLMTMEGDIRAIGRYGISGQKTSVLVRASFEETKKHLINASIRGEKDHLRGTIENIMMNQVAPIGTGSFELYGRIPEIMKAEKTIPKKVIVKAEPAKKAVPAKKKPTAKKAVAKKTSS